MAGIGQDLKKIYSDETRIVENASLCTVQLYTFKLVVKGRENQDGGKESLMLIARHLSP